MKANSMNGGKIALTAGLVAAFLGASVYADQLETVTVTGSRGVSEKQVASSAIGAPINEITVSYRVKIGDLDLKTVDGQKELHKRVTTAATAACREIDRIAFGNATSTDDATCIKKAFDEAVASAQPK